MEQEKEALNSKEASKTSESLAKKPQESVAHSPVTTTEPSASPLTHSIDYFGVAGILLIIIGWKVIYANGKRLATRSETKSALDGAIELISQIEQLTTEYWLAGRRYRIDTEKFELLASAKMSMLDSQIKVISRRGIEVPDTSLSDLATDMTLNCERVDQMPPQEIRSQVQIFLNTSSQLKDQLYLAFEERHRPAHSLWGALISRLRPSSTLK